MKPINPIEGSEFGTGGNLAAYHDGYLGARRAARLLLQLGTALRTGARCCLASDWDPTTETIGSVNDPLETWEFPEESCAISMVKLPCNRVHQRVDMLLQLLENGRPGYRSTKKSTAATWGSTCYARDTFVTSNSQRRLAHGFSWPLLTLKKKIAHGLDCTVFKKKRFLGDVTTMKVGVGLYNEWISTHNIRSCNASIVSCSGS